MGFIWGNFYYELEYGTPPNTVGNYLGPFTTFITVASLYILVLVAQFFGFRAQVLDLMLGAAG